MNPFEAFCNFFMRLQNSKRQKRNMISSECGVVLCFSILLWEVWRKSVGLVGGAGMADALYGDPCLMLVVSQEETSGLGVRLIIGPHIFLGS